MKRMSTILLLFIGTLHGCGGEEGDVTLEADPSTTINTEKLVGTPFEGLTSGDNFPWYYFICDQYQSTTIDSFPLYVFMAYFTAEEEEIIQQGIDLANSAMGFAAYALTDSWSDTVRVIYKSDYIEAGGNGEAKAFFVYFNEKIVAERFAPDWAIELMYVSPYVVAHELGHASGIAGHYLIDYENNTITDLEDSSVMNSSGGGAFTDYNFMMSMQGQIMQNHLGEEGTLYGGDCDFLKDYYDNLEE